MTRQDIKSAKDVAWFIQACINEEEVEFSNDGTRWHKDIAGGITILPCVSNTSPFHSDKCGWCKYVRPLPKKERRILGPVKMMDELIREGRDPDQYGNFECDDFFNFPPSHWALCGKRVMSIKHGLYKIEDRPIIVPEKWTELVEVTE